MAEQNFENSGFRIGEMFHFSPKAAYEAASNGAVIVDVRQDYETLYKGFDVQNLIHIHHEEIKDRYAELPADKFLIVADSVGIHSKEVTGFLITKGFAQLANMAGGIFAWERDGLPIAVNKKEKLTGSCACMLKPHGKIQKKMK
jgi:rhodanese-related sulfurtransferase